MEFFPLQKVICPMFKTNSPAMSQNFCDIAEIIEFFLKDFNTSVTNKKFWCHKNTPYLSNINEKALAGLSQKTSPHRLAELFWWVDVTIPKLLLARYHRYSSTKNFAKFLA